MKKSEAKRLVVTAYDLLWDKVSSGSLSRAMECSHTEVFSTMERIGRVIHNFDRLVPLTLWVPETRGGFAIGGWDLT